MGCVLKKSLFGVLFFVFSLIGCGGGSVSIERMNAKDWQIPPDVLVTQLFNSTFDEQREILFGLKKEDGKFFNWSRFWQLLANDSRSYQLVRDHGDTLLSLHSRDCRAYENFVHFVTVTKFGASYLIGAERKCLPALFPRIVSEAFDTFYPQFEARGDTASVDALYRFVASEVRTQPTSIWLDAFGTGTATPLHRAASHTLNAGPNESLDQLMVAFLKSTGTVPLPDIARKMFFGDSSVVNTVFVKHGTDEAVGLLGRLVSGTDFAFSDTELDTFVTNAIDAHLRANSGRLLPILKRNAQVRALVLGASKHNLAAQLRSREKLQRATEEEILKLRAAKDPKTRAENLAMIQADLSEALQSVDADENLLEMIWLEVRVRGTALVDRDLRQKLDRSARNVKNSVDEILVARLRMHLAEDEYKKADAIQAFCDLLEQRNIRKQHQTFEEMQRAFQSGGKTDRRVGMPAGCFVLKDPPAQVSFAHDQPIVASFDSVIQIDDRRVQFDAPEVDLGAVRFERLLTKDPVPAENPPDEANAIVIPVLFGLALEKPTPGLFRGTHFFIYHYEFKPAKDGKKSAKTAEEGFPGSPLVLKVDRGPRPFVFLSTGGPGQKGAPPLKGGAGDGSHIETVGISSITTDLELSTLKDGLPPPAYFHPQLSLLEFGELLTNAIRAKDGSFTVILPEYFRQADSADAAQIRKICAAGGVDTSDSVALLACVESKIAPDAFESLRAKYLRAVQDRSIDLGAKFRYFNAESVFEVPAGARGPENADGAIGSTTTTVTIEARKK